MTANSRTPAQGADTRRRILEAATTSFGRLGYARSTLADIAGLAGVGQSNVLHHFGSKDDLLLEVLEEQFQISIEALDDIADGRTTLADWFDAIAEGGAHARDRVRLFSVIAGESLIEGHPAQAFFTARYDELRERYTDAVVKGSAARGLAVRPPNVVRLVTLVTAAMDGLQLQWLRNPESVDMRSAMSAVTDLVRARLSEAAARRENSTD